MVVWFDQFQDLFFRDVMLLHEQHKRGVVCCRVRYLLPSQVQREGMISLCSPRCSFAFRHVLFSMADRAQQDFPGLTFFLGDSIYIHSIRVFRRFYQFSCRRGEALAFSSDIAKLDVVPVKFSCLFQPLFPFSSSLFLASWQSGSSHHDS